MLRHRACLQWGLLTAPRASPAHPAATQATDPGTPPSKLTQAAVRRLKEISRRRKPTRAIKTTALYTSEQEHHLLAFRLKSVDNRAKKAIEKEKVHRLIAKTQDKIIAKLDE